MPKPYPPPPRPLKGSTVIIEAKVKTITKALAHIHNFVWVRMKAEFMLESILCNGSKLRNRSVLNGQGGGCEGGPQGLFCRSEETGSGQRAPVIPGVAILARPVITSLPRLC